MAENDDSKSEFYLALLSAIEDNYSPADNIPEADFLKSTSEILESLQEMLPGLDADTLVEFLEQSGYKFTLRGEMDFAWMFKNKKIIL